MRHLFILLITILFACSPKGHEQTTLIKDSSITVKDSVVGTPIDSTVEYLPANKDSLRRILGSAKVDSLEKKGFFEDFTYLQIGNLLSKDYLSAIFISDAGKEKHHIQIFNNKEGLWVKAGENTIGDFMLAQLDISMADYNFDGLQDIYIQSSMSNGIGISRGHLLTQNADANFTYHNECISLGNMEPDNSTKTINSVEYIYCEDGKNQFPSGSLCKLSHQWKNGKLIQIKKECPCIGNN